MNTNLSSSVIAGVTINMIIAESGSSTSIFGKGLESPKGIQSPEKIVCHMYKYAIFNIKPTYNTMIKFYTHKKFHFVGRPVIVVGRAPL